MNRNQKLFSKILKKQGHLKIIEMTISAFATLNKVNDYILDKVDRLNRQENYSLNSSNQLAYAFARNEFEDFNKVFARCKVMLGLFEFILENHEQDILDEYGPQVGRTLRENCDNMHELLNLGNQWIIQAESNFYSPDLELNALDNIATGARPW